MKNVENKTIECSYTLHAYLNINRIEVVTVENYKDIISDSILQSELEQLIRNNKDVITKQLEVSFPNDFISELNSATTFHAKSKLCTCVGMCAALLRDINKSMSRSKIYLEENAEEFIGDLNYFYETNWKGSEVDSGNFMLEFLNYSGYKLESLHVCEYHNKVCTFSADSLTIFNTTRREVVTKSNMEYNRLGIKFKSTRSNIIFTKMEPYSEYKYIVLREKENDIPIVCKQSINGDITINNIQFNQLYSSNQNYETIGFESTKVNFINKLPSKYITMEELAEVIVDEEFIDSDSLNNILDTGNTKELVENIYEALPTTISNGDYDFNELFDYTKFCQEVVKVLVIKLCEIHPDTTLLHYIDGYVDYKLDQEKRIGDHTKIVKILEDNNTIEIIPFGVDELISLYKDIKEDKENITITTTINQHLKLTLT